MEIRMDLSQNLVLSQRMIQSAEILQMNSQELEVFLKTLATENPLVEMEDDFEEEDSKNDIQKKLEWLESTDEQNRIYYNQDYADEEYKKEDFLVQDKEEKDFTSYLLAQLITMDLGEDEFEVVSYMINSLDSKGYLDESLEHISTRFGLKMNDTLRCLEILQSLEPAGVGAASLRECLLLQLDRKELDVPVARRIIENHLDLLGKNQIHILAKKLKTSIEEILKAEEIIKVLNPKPSRGYASRENLKYITPDVIIVRFEDYFEVLLNQNSYPGISINSYYQKLLHEDNSKEIKDYVRTKLKQVEWIRTCITQRNSTLLKVAKTIVDIQELFFIEGKGNLKPLKLYDIAEVLGIHESTVSRATRGKYLQCSWGVFPMNYFFSKGIEDMDSGHINTAESIKKMINEIIDKENKQKPYSDRIITEILNQKGIKISRRTVAKYREAMNIRDANGRRSFV